MSSALIKQLDHVLDLERQALMSADFAPMGDLLQQKEKILEGLTRSSPSSQMLRPLRTKMDENQSLLAAAIKGVAAAGERLQALQNVQSSLSVYDASGRVELAQKHQRNLEKKA